MSSGVYGAPLRVMEGETKSLSTTAGYIAVKPKFHEVKMYCASQWRLALSPKLIHAVTYDGTAFSAEYVQSVTDRVATTHMPLDAMPATTYCYLGFSEPALGVYLDLHATNKNAETASLDVEYCYDSADAGYKKITGTISGALTVGETVTGGTSGATATLVLSGATYITVKNITGVFAIGETISGAAETCSAVTAIGKSDTTPFFTDVTGDSDGTDSPGATLSKDGVYTWTLPTDWARSALGAPNAEKFSKCYWIRFKPSATLSATIDVQEIIPVYQNVNYGYMEPGIEYQFSFSETDCGGFVVLSTAGTPTLDVSWVEH